MTVPLIFIWPHALLFWPVLVWVAAPELRFLRKAKKSGAMDSAQDAGTAKLVIRGTNVLLSAAIAAAFVVPVATVTYQRTAFFFFGVGMMVGGSLLRRHCFRKLGAHFTYAVQVRADQPVIDSGAYRLVRHPSYLAGMLLYASWGVALTNWVSIALLLAGPALIYARRVVVEERALVATIGGPYERYMRRTKRLIPYIY